MTSATSGFHSSRNAFHTEVQGRLKAGVFRMPESGLYFTGHGEERSEERRVPVSTIKAALQRAKPACNPYPSDMAHIGQWKCDYLYWDPEGRAYFVVVALPDFNKLIRVVTTYPKRG